MKRLFCALTMAIGAAGLVACDERALESPDLRRLLAGNSIEGRTADQKTYVVHFTASGLIYMDVEDGFADQGRWRVSNDDKYCRQWSRIGGAKEVCYAVFKVNDQLTFTRDEERLSVTWLAGNPRQLPRIR